MTLTFSLSNFYLSGASFRLIFGLEKSVMPCGTLAEILYDNVSAKHNDILFELLFYLYNHIYF